MTLRTGILLAVLATLVIGCTTEGGPTGGTSESADVASLRRQLLKQDEKIARLETELAALRADRYELAQLLKQAKALIQSLEDKGQLPRDEVREFKPVSVGLGFLTTAIDTDGNKGDDAIAAYVYLYDRDGSSIKYAGSFRFELFDLSRESDQVIGVWTFPPEVAAKHWALFPSGFQFKLPFSGAPTARRTILKVTFEHPGEKALTATRELVVDLP